MGFAEAEEGDEHVEGACSGGQVVVRAAASSTFCCCTIGQAQRNWCVPARRL